jgi:hypothetical protein
MEASSLSSINFSIYFSLVSFHSEGSVPHIDSHCCFSLDHSRYDVLQQTDANAVAFTSQLGLSHVVHGLALRNLV